MLIQQSSLPSLAQKEIERMILSGDLVSGAKLNEGALADMLGISRGPVREAFRALEECGLVLQKKNCGVFVREISLEEADQIYEIREALDELVGRKLATSITPAQIKDLTALLSRMEKAVSAKSVERYFSLNLAFHDLLVSQAGNTKLLTTYRRLIKELTLYRLNNLKQQGALPGSIREHREILDHIVAGNADAAGTTMRRHVSESRRAMHRAYTVAAKANLDGALHAERN